MNGGTLSPQEHPEGCDCIQCIADGFALWEEFKPQSAEDWVAVAKRCAADPTFDYRKSSPLFGAAYLLAKELLDG